MSEAIAELDLQEHPAVRAWSALMNCQARPVAIERLQKRKKAQVYRLVGAGPGPGCAADSATADVIAKCSSRERISMEHVIYERVLPALPIRAVTCYGSYSAPGCDECWLFVEDAGGELYSPQCYSHRVLAARWLGLLHTAAVTLCASAELPNRATAFYRSRLRAGRAHLLAHVSNPALSAREVTLLKDVARQCETVDDHWAELEEWCAAVPATLVHGDFAPKNMHVRRGPDGDTVLPFDWGSAGWGSLASDLAQAGTTSGDCWDYWAHADLATYLAVVRRSWPSLTLEAVERLAVAGKLFRSLVCIYLEAPSFACDWVKSAARNMKVYRAAMGDAIRSAGWD
jgi:hypothetical protein